MALVLVKFIIFYQLMQTFQLFMPIQSYMTRASILII